MFVGNNQTTTASGLAIHQCCDNSSQISILKNNSSYINVEVNQPIKSQNPVCIKENQGPYVETNAINMASIAEKQSQQRQQEKQEKQKRFDQVIKQRARMIQKENQIKKKQQELQKIEWKKQQLGRSKISYEQSSIGYGKKIVNSQKINGKKFEVNSQNTSQISEQEQQQVPQPIQQQDKLGSIVEQVTQEEEKETKVEIILPQKDKKEEEINDEYGDDEEFCDRDDMFDCENGDQTINKYQAMRMHLGNYTIPDSYSETYSQYFGYAPVFEA